MHSPSIAGSAPEILIQNAFNLRNRCVQYDVQYKNLIRIILWDSPHPATAHAHPGSEPVYQSHL